MGSHAQTGRSRRTRGGIARFAIPVVTGVVIFGAVTAFAATLSVNSKSLGSGNATVSSCNTAATVTYTTAYAATLPGYKVATAPVTTAAACNGFAYKVTLTGAANAALAEVTGTLDASGNATPDFSASNIAAANVTGVSVVITG
ncbi:MAG: hypothetical protein QOC82_962 [Frankiaceae bacterium]|jgi:hypothetical protein|nr:hypothetical protein [Frankiaceae bacterium]MDQ1699091.1 hypothetical protein [Frankiaceae bacterium]